MRTKNSRVLVIDDDQPVRELIACVLRSRGIQVIQAESGKEGIDLALTANPALILSDIRMPDIDGFAVLDRLQRDPQSVHIPFILMTGWADCLKVASQLKRGVTVLKKPFDPQMLMNTVLAHLPEQPDKPL